MMVLSTVSPDTKYQAPKQLTSIIPSDIKLFFMQQEVCLADIAAQPVYLARESASLCCMPIQISCQPKKGEVTRRERSDTESVRNVVLLMCKSGLCHVRSVGFTQILNSR